MIFCDVFTNQRPYTAEYSCGTGEVETCHTRIRQQIFADIRTAAWNKVDNAIWQSSFFHQLHEVVVGKSSSLSWFPDNGVAHDCWSGAKVAADRGKVKWRNSHYKAIQRTVLGAVPYAMGVFWLLFVDLFSKCNVEAQEVCKLASRVNLSLESGFALTKHGSGIHLCTPWTSQQVSSFQEDGSSVFPRHVSPFFFCSHCSISSQFQFFFASNVVFSQNMVEVMRHNTFAFVAGVVFFAADDDRNFNLNGSLTIQFFFQCFTLWAAWQISFYRLIVCFWNCEVCVAHGVDILSKVYIDKVILF